MTARTSFFSVLFSGFVIFFALANPANALAVLSVVDVSPDSVLSNATSTITITGTDFTVASIVRINGLALATTYVNSTTLTAEVFPGITPGVYDVLVEIPGTGSAILQSGITILAPTATLAPFARPQIVIDIYTVTVSAITYGQDFNVNVSLDNAGGSTAYGLQITFSSIDLLMLKNGGVTAVGMLGTVGKADISQTMTAAASLYGKTMVSVDMNVAYYDDIGTTYSEKFTIYIPVASVSVGGGGVVATSTPTGVRRSQLVITDYSTGEDPLQPGLIFRLNLTLKNVGTIPARSVSMIVGGGSTSGGGTPQAGVSAGSGEFTNFAPVGTSNVQLLGNLEAGASLEATQELIVNVSTNPGAYPIKISFVYTDSTGNVINDEQVITLLVYRLPQVEIGFYQPVGELYVGQGGLLPIQVVNLGRSTVVLGTMVIETTGGSVENGQMLVGALDMGGYFPLDAILYPDAPGTYELLITIKYTDDFNQPRTITQTLSVEVLEGSIEPSPDPNFPAEPVQPSSEETFWQKLWRFILGLFGLDSSTTAPSFVSTEVPIEPIPAGSFPSGGKG